MVENINNSLLECHSVGISINDGWDITEWTGGLGCSIQVIRRRYTRRDWHVRHSDLCNNNQPLIKRLINFMRVSIKLVEMIWRIWLSSFFIAAYYFVLTFLIAQNHGFCRDLENFGNTFFRNFWEHRKIRFYWHRIWNFCENECSNVQLLPDWQSSRTVNVRGGQLRSGHMMMHVADPTIYKQQHSLSFLIIYQSTNWFRIFINMLAAGLHKYIRVVQELTCSGCNL